MTDSQKFLQRANLSLSTLFGRRVLGSSGPKGCEDPSKSKKRGTLETGLHHANNFAFPPKSQTEETENIKLALRLALTLPIISLSLDFHDLHTFVAAFCRQSSHTSQHFCFIISLHNNNIHKCQLPNLTQLPLCSALAQLSTWW